MFKKGGAIEFGQAMLKTVHMGKCYIVKSTNCYYEYLFASPYRLVNLRHGFSQPQVTLQFPTYLQLIHLQQDPGTKHHLPLILHLQPVTTVGYLLHTHFLNHHPVSVCRFFGLGSRNNAVAVVRRFVVSSGRMWMKTLSASFDRSLSLDYFYY